MEPNIPSPVCRKDGVEIHAAVPKDITEAFSVIAVRENGAWLLVRHSARKTWELPGGHREPDETPLEAACRELYEETGALRFRLCACGCYSVTQGGQTSWGALFLAEAITRGPLPESEIAQVRVPLPHCPARSPTRRYSPYSTLVRRNTCAAARWKTHLSSARPYGRGNARERCSLSSRRGDCRRGAA